jgi:hypothetical protein
MPHMVRLLDRRGSHSNSAGWLLHRFCGPEIDPGRADRDFRDIGRSLLFLNKSPVFAYISSVYGTADDGSLLANVADDGTLSPTRTQPRRGQGDASHDAHSGQHRRRSGPTWKGPCHRPHRLPGHRRAGRPSVEIVCGNATKRHERKVGANLTSPAGRGCGALTPPIRRVPDPCHSRGSGTLTSMDWGMDCVMPATSWDVSTAEMGRSGCCLSAGRSCGHPWERPPAAVLGRVDVGRRGGHR